MGTRGYLGVQVCGGLKGSYNHFDSYPDGLGQDTVDFLIPLVDDPEKLKRFAVNMAMVELVTKDEEPTEEQQKKYAEFHNAGVSSGKSTEWYSLLRECQGVQGLIAIENDRLFHLIDGNQFPFDSLFCEWAYIINLDEKKLEIYKGFQKNPVEGRFKGNPDDSGYYGCKLIKELSFTRLKNNWDKFLKELDSEED